MKGLIVNKAFWDKYFSVLKRLQWINNLDYENEGEIVSLDLVYGNCYIKTIFNDIMEYFELPHIFIIAECIKEYLKEAMMIGESLPRLNSLSVPLYEAFRVLLGTYFINTYSDSSKGSSFHDAVCKIMKFSDKDLNEFNMNSAVG